LRWQQRRRRLALPPLGKPQAVSLVVIVAIVVVLLAIGASNGFYVYRERVTIVGNHLLSSEEIYRTAGVEGVHLFFVKPSAVAARVARLPYVRHAHVQVKFPSGLQISVQERVPFLRWERAGKVFWVDEEGVVMPARATSRALMVVADPRGTAPAITKEGVPTRLAPRVLVALREVSRIMPQVKTVYYDPAGGLWLILHDPGGDIQVHLGTARGVGRRIVRLPALLQKMRAQGKHFRLIDLRNPEEVVALP